LRKADSLSFPVDRPRLSPRESGTISRELAPWEIILIAGFVTGILDGLENVIFNKVVRGIPPIRIFHYIASGLIGVRAFHEGWPTAVLGLGLHLLIAFSAAAAYYYLSQKLKLLRDRPFVGGVVFGVALFIFMRSVVIPLSAAPKQPPMMLSWLLNLVFAHIFCVGFPIAWLTTRLQRA
jgi:hypothetical protein